MPYSQSDLELLKGEILVSPGCRKYRVLDIGPEHVCVEDTRGCRHLNEIEWLEDMRVVVPPLALVQLGEEGFVFPAINNNT